LGRLKLAARFTLLIFVVAFVGGFVFGQQPEYHLPLEQNFDFTEAAGSFSGFFNLPTQTGVMSFIFWQNARVLLGATVLGLFTFGIGGLAISPTFLLLGYIFSQILQAGYDPLLLVAALLPHGIIEIPVVFIASAAAVRLGASITRPPQGMTVGQGLQQALGDTIKIGAGVVLPGLIIAAALEAFLTPLVVVAVMSG
ncbi:MAG: stage II sporulation protein M, partial [Anaerolineae bacterium]|nr:stage II sporulation protein M [Anaerolineae bacterium]